MTTPFFVADAANVTVLRSVASTAFGKYDLQVPEGIDLEDIHSFAAPGNELGYVAGLSGERVGGMMRRFVRADVSVTAANESDPSWVPDSNVDQVLREAEQRVSGDFFLESDITLAGLGPWVPFVDFQVGDTANVDIWGRVIQLPVTRIEPVVSDHSVVDFRVHVGGQLVSDEDARLAENETIRRALVEDRRDLAGLKAQVSKAVQDSSEAKKTADETAALVDGLDIEGSIQRAREAVDSSNAILQLVRQLTGAAAAQGAQAQASASLAIEYANRAEEVLDKLDPLRDDVVAAHAEVARLSGEAAKAAQAAAAAVAQGEKHVVAAQRAANAAAADADESQQLVDEAQALLAELSPLQDAARKSLADAQSLLDNVDGSGRSLADVLKDVAAKHQAVLAAHDDILATHSEVLEIHGEAIRYAAMAAAQAGAAAMQASQAAAEALRAADLNAQAIAALAEADKKLIEADKKLQEQIDVLEESQRLLAQALRYVAAAAAQAAQAAMSAAQASEENANAIAQTNIAVDAASDSLEALEEASAARDEVVGNIQKSVDAATTAGKARDEVVSKLKTEFQNALKLQTATNTRLSKEQPKTLFFEVDASKLTTSPADNTVAGNGMRISISKKDYFAGVALVTIEIRKINAWTGSVMVDAHQYNLSGEMGKAIRTIENGSTSTGLDRFMWPPYMDFSGDIPTSNNTGLLRIGTVLASSVDSVFTVRCVLFPQDADINAVTK